VTRAVAHAEQHDRRNEERGEERDDVSSTRRPEGEAEAQHPRIVTRCAGLNSC
jgi:hypothetical protein